MMTSLCFVFFVLSAIPHDNNNNNENVEVNETKRNANGATEEKFNSFSSFFRSFVVKRSIIFLHLREKRKYFSFVSFNVCSVVRLRSQAWIVNSAHVACIISMAVVALSSSPSQLCRCTCSIRQRVEKTQTLPFSRPPKSFNISQPPLYRHKSSSLLSFDCYLRC